MSSQARLGFYLLLTPLLLWLTLLIIIPHIDMFLISIKERVGVGKYETSPANYLVFFKEPLYLVTFVRTAMMSILATGLTLLIAFPVSYYIAKIAKGRLQSSLFLLCLVPFWVSELVRTFGWIILLRETGVISNFLQWTGVASGPVEMLYNDTAMMIGLIYTSMLLWWCLWLQPLRVWMIVLLKQGMIWAVTGLPFYAKLLFRTPCRGSCPVALLCLCCRWEIT